MMEIHVIGPSEMGDTLPFDPALYSARRCLYRFAALTLADPRHGTSSQLSHASAAQLLNEAAAIVGGEPAARADSLGLGERSLVDLDPSPVLASLPASAERPPEAQ